MGNLSHCKLGLKAVVIAVVAVVEVAAAVAAVVKL